MSIVNVREQRVDYFTARATSEVTFPIDKTTPLEVAEGQTVNIAFSHAMRGCSTEAVGFDSAQERNVARLESLMTWFHADDERPGWVRNVQLLARDATPPEVPRGLRGIAATLIARYGPGSVTVTNDPSRPITGALIAGEPGANGEFFPANSFFDQFLVARLGGRSFTHREALRVTAKVRAWPPEGEHYKSDGATDFYDVDDPDGPAVFRFGNCNIDILHVAPEEEVAAVREVIEVIHG
jgi:hypothetical protein